MTDHPGSPFDGDLLGAETEVRERVRALVQSMAPEPQEATDATSFVDLGYHSLALVELAFAVELEFDLEPIQAEEVEGVETVLHLQNFVLLRLEMLGDLRNGR